MDPADEAVVFYSKHALALKRLPDLPETAIQSGFDKENLVVLNDKENLLGWLLQYDPKDSNLLLMSSGNFDGLDILTFVQQILT